jgi:hypothetical protein
MTVLILNLAISRAEEGRADWRGPSGRRLDGRLI